MATDIRVTREQLGEAIDPAELRALQILHLALVMGAVLFLLTVILLAALAGVRGQPGDAAPADVTLHVMLTAATAFYTLAGFTAGLVIERRGLSARLRKAGDAAQVLGALRGVRLVRLALMEGAALLGSVTCFLAVHQHVAAQQPWLWVNAFPTALLVAVTAFIWPTRQELLRLFDEAAVG